MNDTSKPLAVNIRDAAAMTGLTDRKLRALIREKRLRISRIGKRILIPMIELERLIERGMKA